MIQGIEVSDLSDAEDGDVLMIQDGVWVATTSVSEDDDGISVSLNEVEDVSECGGSNRRCYKVGRQ